MPLLRSLWARVAEVATKYAAATGYDVPPQLWPDAVDVEARRVTCGDGVCASFVVVDYPAQLPGAWLDVVSTAVDHADVALHVTPIDPSVAATHLKRARARLESTRRYQANKDRVDDPAVEAAAEEAADLAGRVAVGAARLFTTSVYITVHAPTLADLDAACARLRSVAAAVMLDVRPATWRALPALTSTLPIGVDALGVTRTLDTDTVAASFPFTSPDAPDIDSGVLYGLNVHTGAPVWWDRWNCDNHNSVVIAQSGAGKSYFTKSEITRQVIDGCHVLVVDPDGEYAPLAKHLGGDVVNVGDVHLNPLALPIDADNDALTRRVMFAHSLAATMLGAELTPSETRVLDDAVLAAYEAAGITHASSTWDNDAPTLVDVLARLQDDGDGQDLAARLAPYVTGGLSGLFTGRPVTVAGGHLTVFALRDLPDELMAAATLIVVDAVWRGIRDDGRRRLVVVDEAWLLLSRGAGAQFLARLAKSARKRRAGLMTVTQDVEDMMGTDLGRAVIANAATQVILRQAPQSLDPVATAFHLTAAEREFVGSAGRGEALLVSGDTHVAFRAVASESEHVLFETGIGSGR